MSTQENPNPREHVPQTVELPLPCPCGSKQFYGVHSLTIPGTGKVSIMYECVECGEYRL